MTRYRFTQRDLRPPTEHRLVTRGAQAPSRSRRALSLVLGAALAIPVANSPVLLAQSASVSLQSGADQQPTEQGHDLPGTDGSTAETPIGTSPALQAASPQGREADGVAAEENRGKAEEPAGDMVAESAEEISGASAEEVSETSAEDSAEESTGQLPGTTLAASPAEDNSGIYILAPSTALWGAYAMGTLGAIGQRAEVGIPLGVGAGALLGGGAALLIGMNRDFTTRQAGYYTLGQIWGAGTGWVSTAMVQSQLEEDGTEEDLVLKTRQTLGPIGMGAGLLITSLAPRQDFATLHLSGLAGTLGAYGLGKLLAPETPERALGVAFAGTGLGLAELAAGVLLSSDAPLTNRDAYTTLHLTSHALFAGAFLPYLLTPNPAKDQRLGSALTLTSIGLLGSQLIGQRVELSTNATHAISLNGALGAMLGAGLPMSLGALDNTDEEPVGILQTTSGLLIGQLAGLGLGALTHTRFDEDRASSGYQVAGAAFGAYQAIGIGYTFYDRGDLTKRQLAGVTLASSGLLGIGGMALDPSKGNRTKAQGWVMTSSLTWGAWFGAWSAVAAEASNADVLLSATLGSDLGLAAGLALASPKLDLSPISIGYTSLCGIGGAALANVVGLTISDEGRTLGVANLVGSAAGLTLGALTAQFLPKKKLTRRHTSTGSSNRFEYELGKAFDRAMAWKPVLSVAPVASTTFGNADGNSVPMSLNLALTQPVWK